MGTVEKRGSGASLFGKTRSGILSLLYGRPSESFYLREIVQLMRTGAGAVQRELGVLQGLGVVKREKRGNQIHFSANLKSPIYTEIRSIVQKMDGWLAVLQHELQPLSDAIQSAFVYGSYAAHVHGADSDVDLFAVGNVDEMALHRAITSAEEKVAKTINYTLLSPKEYAKRRREKGGFIARILRGPKIPVIGEDL